MSLVERMTLDINRRELVKREVESRSNVSIKSSTQTLVFNRLIDDTNRRNLISQKVETFKETREKEELPSKKYGTSQQLEMVHQRLLRDAENRKEINDMREKLIILKEESEMNKLPSRFLDKKRAEELVRRLNQAARLKDEKLKALRNEKEENEINQAIDMANSLHPKRQLDPKVMERLTKFEKHEEKEIHRDSSSKKVFNLTESKASGERLMRARSNKPPIPAHVDGKIVKKINNGQLKTICQRLYENRSFTPTNRPKNDEIQKNFQKNKKQLLNIPRRPYAKSKSPTSNVKIGQKTLDLNIISKPDEENIVHKSQLLEAANGYFDQKQKPAVKPFVNLLVPSKSNQNILATSPSRGRSQLSLDKNREKTPSPIKAQPIPSTYSLLEICSPTNEGFNSPKSMLGSPIQSMNTEFGSFSNDLKYIFQQSEVKIDEKFQSSNKNSRLLVEESLTGRNTQASALNSEFQSPNVYQEKHDVILSLLTENEKRLDSANFHTTLDFSKIAKNELCGLLSETENKKDLKV